MDERAKPIRGVQSANPRVDKILPAEHVTVVLNREKEGKKEDREAVTG